MRSLRSVAIGLLLAGVATVLAVMAAEIALRYSGYSPKELTPVRRTVYAWAAPDPAFGWVNRPGSQTSFEDSSVLMHHSADFTRRDDLRLKKKALPKVLVLGCSYTQGYGVADEQVYSALLNRELADVEIVNFGTAGYSAYQSLLRMRHELAKEQSGITTVIYGFIDHHMPRNVADGSWIRALPTPTGGTFGPPYVRVKNDSLVEFPGVVRGIWPGEKRSALVHLAHETVLAYANWVSESEQANAQHLLVRQMDAGARAKGVRFLAVGLEYDDKYSALFRDVAFADCRFPGTRGYLEGGVPANYKVADGHPNARIHEYWSNCIKQELSKLSSR